MTDNAKTTLTYKEAGVDINAGNETVRLLTPLARSTFNFRVLNDIGSFSGLYSLSNLSVNEPVLVSSTDGVGTKLKVAIMADKHDTVGVDLVAMSVNDILSQGAKPLFFLDYLAMDKIIPQKVSQIVTGIAEGCRQAGCSLLGGETAEMPGLYQSGDYDLAGFAVGLVDRDAIIDGSSIALGYQILGLPSSGLHSNGFSLARKIIFEKCGLGIDSPLLGQSVAETLLTPTRIYVAPVLAALKGHCLHGVVHVTGGGLLENIPRVLPMGCRATIKLGSWEIPPIFDFLAKEGRLEMTELYRTFNMGLGLLLVVRPTDVDSVINVLQDHGESPVIVGMIEAMKDTRRVVLE
jgi:phosphoribosylformylglycinamidine cyclo-ligase